MNSATSKIVLVFGVFDLLHRGHLHFLEQARTYGDKLIVIVNRDERVISEKGRAPIYPLEKRIKMLSCLDCVSKAVPGNKIGQWNMVEKYRPDVICVGYDQNPNHPKLLQQIENLAVKPKIVVISAKDPAIYKTSILREQLGI